MALSSSPTSHASYEDDPLYQSTHFTQDISTRMRVPKRIKGTGEYYEEQDMWSNHSAASNGNSNAWNYQDKFDMTVPDRIVVIGQEQHHGTRSAPREILLENSIMKSPDRDTVRVSTPPRSIILSQHHFPSASDDLEVSSQTDTLNAEDEDDLELTSVARAIDSVRHKDQQANSKNHFRTVDRFHNSRGSTPPLNQSLMETMTPSEELLHLRKSIQHMRARVLTIELEMAQLAQREKYFIFGGMGYLLLKFIWYLRSK